MAQTILVAVDGSPLSRRAFDRALEDSDERVVVLHVIDPSDPGYSTPVDVDTTIEPRHGSEEWYERAREHAQALFDELEDRGGQTDIDVEMVTVSGDPARSVVDYAESNDVDQIYVGGHGRSGETNITLGRVAELVVARAPVTVTVVR
ncbi:MAG: universal stress protein [Salinigranum sp.]